MEQSGVSIDPTTPHKPQENTVAECSNKTVLGRILSTLHAAGLPFQRYLFWCALETVSKYNSKWQAPVNDFPRVLWNSQADALIPCPRVTPNLSKYRMFGEYAHVVYSLSRPNTNNVHNY